MWYHFFSILAALDIILQQLHTLTFLKICFIEVQFLLVLVTEIKICNNGKQHQNEKKNTKTIFKVIPLNKVKSQVPKSKIFSCPT